MITLEVKNTPSQVRKDAPRKGVKRFAKEKISYYICRTLCTMNFYLSHDLNSLCFFSETKRGGVETIVILQD